ncbi:MAG: phage portal protein [Bacteroidota bacterium]
MMSEETFYVKKDRQVRWYNPLTWIRRASYTQIGSLKDWDAWKGIIYGANKSKVIVNERTAQGVPALWRAYNITAEQVASLSLSVYTKESDGSIREATSHPLYKLLKFRPGPEYSSFDFRETMVRQIVMRGRSFVYPVRDNRGAITRLILLPPPADIFESKAGVLTYVFQNVGFAKKEYVLRWDEVLHFKAYSRDGLTSQNPLNIFHEAMGVAISQIDYAGSYFGNGAHVSGLLTPESPMQPKQVDQVIEFWNRHNTGPDKVGKTGIIPFGMKYQKLGSNLQDSDFAANRRLSIEDIGNITGVPVDLLNSGDKTSTYASAEQRIKQFVNFVVRAQCKRIEDEMNSKLFPARDLGKTFVRHNIDSLLRGDTKTRSLYYNVMMQNGVFSVNEVRELENKNPVEGGDELRVPMNMEPINFEEDEPGGKKDE